MAEDLHDKKDAGSEYQFNEEQESSTYEYDENEQQVQAGTGLDKKRKKLLIIAVIVIVALFIIYHILRAISGSSPTAQSAAIQKDAAALPAAKTNPAVSKTAALPKASPSQSLETNEKAVEALVKPAPMNNAGTTMGSPNVNQKQLAKLSDQQAANQTQLMNVQSRMSDLNTQMATMNQSLQQVSSNIAKVEQQQRAAQIQANRAWVQKSAAIRHHQEYFVSAVIPGRAWLKSSNGTTITVSVGDQLPGYGKVEAINAYSGAVTTTNATLNYGVSN